MTEAATFQGVIARPEIEAVKAPPSREDERIGLLTLALARGEERAWREFHELYFDRLLRYLLVVCRGDEQAARENLQAGLAKLVRQVRHFEQEEAWWSWLTVVMRSCVIDGARRQSRYLALLNRFSGGLIGAERVRDDPLPHLLEECVKSLPEADRELLRAKYSERQSTAALADSNGCTVKAIESRLARLRARIKTMLLTRLRNES